MNTLSLIAGAPAALRWLRARIGLSPILARFTAEWCRVPVPVPIPVPRRPRLSPASALLAFTATLAAFAAVPASAQDYQNWSNDRSRYDNTADGQLVDVQVLVDGQTAPLYFAPGRWDREYFQAFRGRNYSLVLRNNTGRRVGVLISVDGLNVVNGERSSLGSREPMYVLDPWERTTISGWRTSLNDVRRFVFVDEERSYAERTGQANGDLGWIRVLAFREQGSQWWNDGRPQVRDNARDEIDRYGQREAAPSPSDGKRLAKPETQSHDNAQGYAYDQPPSNPGTGWGDRKWDPVHETWFVGERNATDHLILRYEYASGLRALGITPWNGRGRVWERERGELGFARPPRW